MRIESTTPAFASTPSAAPAATATPIEAVFRAVEDTFDLSGASTIGTLAALTEGEQADFLTITARLLAQGVIGRETREVDGRPYATFAENAIYQPDWLRNAPQYTGSRFDAIA